MSIPLRPFGRTGVKVSPPHLHFEIRVNERFTNPARYLTDLQEEDFSVFEDGIKQDVTLFSRTNLPIALAILLDTSASMETKLPVAQEAAVGFAKRLRKQDLAEVVSFDSRVIVLQTFTNSAGELEQAQLDGVELARESVEVARQGLGHFRERVVEDRRLRI